MPDDLDTEYAGDVEDDNAVTEDPGPVFTGTVPPDEGDAGRVGA